MGRRIFTSEGPDFYALRQRLFTQYDNLAFEPETGLSAEELDLEFNKILECSDVSRMEQKSKLFKLFMEKSRIHIDPADWFADHFEGRRLLYELHERWRKEFKNGVLADAAELLSRSFKTGSFNAELDLGHASPGWRYLLRYGVSGLIENAKEARSHYFCDKKQSDFYEALERVLSGFRTIILRFAALAEEKAICAPEFHARMESLAVCLKNLADNPPQTFYEVLQLSYLFHQLIEFEGEYVRSMGSFERNFSSFLEADLEAGRITEEDAKELIRFYWMKYFANTKGSGNGKNFYFGGQTAPAQDACTRLTYLALDCFYELEQTDPKFSIRFHKNSPAELYQAVARCLRDGRTGMVLVNDEVAIPAILKLGKDPAEVYDYLLIGCYEPAIEGRELACNMSIKFNLTKSIELVFNRGVCPLTGEVIGPDTGALESFTTYESFYNAYKIQLKHQIKQVTEAIKAFELKWPEINPSPLLSSTFMDCIKKGVDLSAGGAKYNNTGCMGAGLANTADSLIAVKKLVFEEQTVTLDGFHQILQDNWQGAEKLQAYVKNRIEKWGNNKLEVDAIACEIAQYYTGLVNGVPNNRGGVFTASMFSLDHNFSLGKRTGALPDGRGAKTYLSKGIGAMTAMDRAGVTAHIQSVTKLDFTNIPNGSVLDINLHPSAVSGDQGLQALIGLIKTYFANGGYAIQFNILDAEELRRAQKEPENYATLQVRLCGWNVYFITLSAEQQEQFIDSVMQVL